jgi:methylated-DNA-protein-cysteine methyltransferase related protein
MKMKKAAPNEFTLKVIGVIKKIPRGKVATYQQIAGLAGKPHASRAVAWILNSCAKKYRLPWQRVINSRGRIAFRPMTHNFTMQRFLLRREGVPAQDNGMIDISRHQWTKKARPKRRRRNQPHMFS